MLFRSFRHLLDPDLLPLDPHPWFDCRAYQRRTGTLAAPGEHPLLRYLSQAAGQSFNPYPHPLWLRELGAEEPLETLQVPPALVLRLQPALSRVDRLGAGPGRARGGLKALKELDAAMQEWPDEDPALPLRWLATCPRVAAMGTSMELPARRLRCWWLQERWEAPLLASLAGAEVAQGRALADVEAYGSALQSGGRDPGPLLLALDEALVETLLERRLSLPAGAAVLNLAWPRPRRQSAWLGLLAQASLVLECRPAVRAYLRGVGLRALWPAPSVLARPGARSEGIAPSLQEDRSGGDGPPGVMGRLHSLGSSSEAPAAWLESLAHAHVGWNAPEGPLPPEDVRGHALLAWFAPDREVPGQVGRP